MSRGLCSSPWVVVFFFLKQKTAYEMRISDWSSDVCSSDLELGKFALFASAVGVGLGFGLQAIFGNFIAGLVLLFDRSLKVGDYVELDADTRGTVHAINIRATRIITNDNIGVLVPNAEFVNGPVVNWTHRRDRKSTRLNSRH